MESEVSAGKRWIVLQNHRIGMTLGATLMALGLLILGGVFTAVTVASNGPGYVALGDSVEFGLGDDIMSDGLGYVDPFGEFLSSIMAMPVTVSNLGESGASTRHIWLRQRRSALAAIQLHRPSGIVVSWGGGGNDLAEVALSPQAAVCMHTPSCLGRFNGLLNEVEHTIDRTISRVRRTGGPDARILMRTQYNALARSGCAAPDAVLLGNATLEGVPGTVLERGLNDRIRTVADRYGAQVVDLFFPFVLNANVLVSVDCVHPSGAGYKAILTFFQAAFLAGP